jgi:multidrug efflux pump subunit AcrA (membrane-fusion protein)
MRRQIQLWVTRAVMVAVVVVAAQRWAVPLYTRYFSPKKAVVFVPTTKVRAGNFTVSFHEIGTLDAERSVQVEAATGGKIISMVEEGTVVKPGDQLVELDNTDAQRDYRNQELAVKNADADVTRAEEELKILQLTNQTEWNKQVADHDFSKTQLEMAQKTYDRKARLAKEELVPGDQVEQADLDVQSKKLALDKAEADLELKKKDIESKETQKKAEIRKVQFAANIQKSNLDEIGERLKQSVVKAPAAGMVVLAKDWTPEGRRKLQEGDSVRPRQTLCSLPDLSSMLIKVNVGEADAPRVRLGMAVLARLEAVPNKVFHGTVKDIASLATEAMPWETGSTPGRKNFEVTIALREADPKVLKPGMTADAEFICDSVANSIYVPIESVVEREGKTYVFVKNGKSYSRVPVVTGKANDNFVVITRGLKRSQVIALRDPTRPMEEQEAGVSFAGTERNKSAKQEAAPVPGAAK